nr:PREDICTED: choline transporter-like protein 1 isoform X2 [Tribolium castaneum]|eukprot:XP_015834016.1 PREDICTED: choline transporter-like protein 1 isoform X2 [Tribolium castaneum]
MYIKLQKMVPSDLFINLGLCQKRKLTDVPMLIIFAICVAILMIIAMIYTISSSDINRGTNGHVLRVLINNSGSLAIGCCIGLGLSLIALFCFRYCVNVFIWTVLIVTVVLMFTNVGFSGYFWYCSGELYLNYEITKLITFIISTFVFLISTILVLVLREQIKLIIEFYKEAMKILFAMPLIFLVPLLTFISISGIFALFCYITFPRIPMNDAGEFYHDTGVIYGRGLVLIMLFWMVEFVLVCQQMVISGAVATYYFTRDKTALVSPIYSSFYNLIRYHLGTVAFGSLVMPTINSLNTIFRVLPRKNCCAYICCCTPMERILKYTTSKGFIATAICGQPFCRSGTRAVNLIVGNLLSGVVMSSVGGFMFFMMNCFVLFITVIIVGFLIFLRFNPTIVISPLFVVIWTSCIFGVVRITVDTVFICYCEDYRLNNGTNEPFYATVELHQKLKKVQDFTKGIEEKACVL